MTLRALLKAWNEFFFAPVSPLPVALFRILYGLCVTATLLLLRPDWLNWYGAHGWLTLSTINQLEPGMRLDLFRVLPQNDSWIQAFFWVFLVFALLLMLGLLTRCSSVIVFLCLTSIHQRNPFILHSGDTFLRVAGFFLMFAPAGAALSLDRLIKVHLVKIRTGNAPLEIQPKSPWAQRMIQLQLALLYFMSFWWKSTGAPWVNGTALYYIAHLNELHRFPVPQWISQPLMQKLGSWLTLVIEFSLGVLIWFRELRYPVLLLGLLFHLYIEYSLNVPMFEWDVLSAYVLFIDPVDLTRAWNWLRRRVLNRFIPLPPTAVRHTNTDAPQNVTRANPSH